MCMSPGNSIGRTPETAELAVAGREFPAMNRIVHNAA
jgi:hypothetical protein